MITAEKLNKMRTASYLLPDPGGEVARELIDEVESLRRKLAITKDGYAVGLGEEVFLPKPDGSASCLTVLGGGGGRLFKASWDHGPPVDVGDCYGSLTTVMEVAEELKESEVKREHDTRIPVATQGPDGACRA